MITREAYILAGPTASGKSAIAAELAREMGAWILSADSMLVYRGMDIGTAKPSVAEREEFHMGGVDVVTPAEEFSSGAWLRSAADWMARVPEDRPIVIVGGTGLYYSALLRGLDRKWEKPAPEYPVIRIDRETVRGRIAARLDDMFMGIPPIAWYGKLKNESRYYDEAVRQIMLFKKRMWVEEKNLFRHGWVEAMDEHPAFFWGRANGWALLTMTEVLDALPKDHPGRGEVMELYRKHAKGLAALQGSEGFWHQLLDRNDSYLETSATAIYVYCMAHGINEGWLSPLAYGPAVILGWNAVCSKINAQGQVLDTCVGTGMGFDPAFYYYRPVSPYAAHGYGPVIFAGAEVIRLLATSHPRLNDSAIQFYTDDMSSFGPIFGVEK